MEAKTRLAAARERAGYRSARQAARKWGWSYTTYASHESGLRNIPPRVAQKYAAAFDVSPEFILFGENPPWWVTKADVVQALRTPTLALPLFSTEEADALRRWIADESDQAETYVITDPGNLSEGAFAVLVSSDAMRVKPPALCEWEILPGDIVLIDGKRNSRPGDVVALLLDESPQIHLRKVVARHANRFMYVPLNSDHAEFDNGEVLGRVSLHIQRR